MKWLIISSTLGVLVEFCFYLGTESPSTLSSLLCGTDVGDIEDEFSLGGSLPTIESFTEEQKKELEELKAESKYTTFI